MINIDNNQGKMLLILKAELTTHDVTIASLPVLYTDDDKRLNFETHQPPKLKAVMVIICRNKCRLACQIVLSSLRRKNIIADSWNKNLNILKDSNSKATPNPIYSGFVQSCSAFSPLSPRLVSFLSKPLCFTQKKIHFPVSSFTPAPNPPPLVIRHPPPPHPCRAPLLPVTPRCKMSRGFISTV